MSRTQPRIEPASLILDQPRLRLQSDAALDCPSETQGDDRGNKRSSGASWGREVDRHIILGSKSAISGKMITKEMATISAIQKGVTPA
jgi:hypothetical protein